MDVDFLGIVVKKSEQIWDIWSSQCNLLNVLYQMEHNSEGTRYYFITDEANE